VSAVWRIAPGQQLAAWGWDEEFVLYNNLSGDTHLFGGDAVAVLEYLQHTPATLDGLVTVFSEDIDPDDAAALPQTMTDLLANLQNLFLVEQC
jgi:PqqD family protein of HPr-rel-A system